MKKIALHFIALLCLVVIAIACTKKKTEDSSCKTCRAAATADRPEATQQVCTEEAEGEFRASHSGQEITCQ